MTIGESPRLPMAASPWTFVREYEEAFKKIKELIEEDE
jgi:hypothetical protein